MEVTQEFVERVREELDVEVRDSYSGRFMYGRSCFAIVGGPSDLMKFAVNLAAMLSSGDTLVGDAIDELRDEWHEVRWDGMGRDLVFYWPNVRVAEV